MLALFEVQDFLKRAGRGEVDSSRLEHLIEQFGEDCKESLRKQLSRKEGYRIRMSGLGRPLCQQKRPWCGAILRQLHPCLGKNVQKLKKIYRKPKRCSTQIITGLIK